MKKGLTRWIVLPALLVLSACSGNQQATPDSAALPPGAGTQLNAPQLLSVTAAKSVSGAPTGIYVIWTREPSASATGYYLYRYTETTRPPEPGPEDNPPFPIELRTNGGAPVPQPASGLTVRFDDVFPAVVGETYYYRVTVVDDQVPPQESYPSNEMGWTVHGHTVASMTPAAAYWGDEITFTGDTFGATQNPGDFVDFPVIGGSTAPGTVTSWTDTEIKVTVPDDAITGRPMIVIDSTSAGPDDDLVILNPIITAIDPPVGFSQQPLTITGEKFGSEQGASTVSIGATDVSGAVTAWSDTDISLTVPAVIDKGLVQLSVDDHPSNGIEFTPRPEIQVISPASAEAGEPVTITGRHFLDSGGRVLLNGSLELDITSWADDAITVTMAGLPGLHVIAVESSELDLSNDQNFTIVPALSIALSGLDPLEIYTPETEPALTVTTPADADRVELIIDDAVVAESTTAPFDDLTLPVATLTNGSHDVHLKAYRRAVEAECADQTVAIYSLPADINGDGVVNEQDRDALESLLWLTSASEMFRPWYDPDGDDAVTEADLSAVGYNWGNRVTP